MLNVKVIKEKYKIRDKKVYAEYELTAEQRELDGCEVRAELSKERIELENHKKFLQEELQKVDQEIVKNLELDNQLELLGYCKLDNPVYKRVDGLIIKGSDGQPIISKFTHQNNCVNKERKV